MAFLNRNLTNVPEGHIGHRELTRGKRAATTRLHPSAIPQLPRGKPAGPPWSNLNRN